MAKKRTQPTLPEGYELLMAPIHAIMSLHGFDTSQTGKNRTYKKPYFDGYMGTLRADIRMYGPDRAYVEFTGIGIDKSRQMEYSRADLTKLENRIKRLKRKAYDEYNQYQRKTATTQKKYSAIAEQLDAKGYTNHSICKFTGNAELIVNGYQIEVTSDLKVWMRLGSQTPIHHVDVDVAVGLLNSFPPNTEEVE